MGLRGFEWAVYVDDDGGRWLMRVDADYYADPDRGWSAPALEDQLVWPQGWRPRQVDGLEPGGLSQSTRVGALDAPLWTGAATSFVTFTSDQEPVTVAVTRHRGERRTPYPPAAP